MARQSQTVADSAWQHDRRVSVDICRLKMPTLSQNANRMQTDDGKRIVQLLEALKQRGILDPTGTHGVTQNGTQLMIAVTSTPGVGPQIHQLNMRRIYRQIMGVELRFEANSSRRVTRPSAGSFGGGSTSVSVDVEVWITF